jgi:hypothetical protein
VAEAQSAHSLTHLFVLALHPLLHAAAHGSLVPLGHRDKLFKRIALCSLQAAKAIVYDVPLIKGGAPSKYIQGREPYGAGRSWYSRRWG